VIAACVLLALLWVSAGFFDWKDDARHAAEQRSDERREQRDPQRREQQPALDLLACLRERLLVRDR